MKNIIEILGTFRLKSKNLFVINAILISGDVIRGMRTIHFDNGLDFEIYSIESIISHGKSSLGITFLYKDAQQLQELEMLVANRKILEFSW